MSDMNWDDVLLSGGASVGKDKRDLYPTASEQWDMIEALEPEEFEYVPSLPEQVIETIATPGGLATGAAIMSTNPLWLIPDVGSAVHEANEYVRSKLPASVKKYWPETGDPWELTTLTADDLMSIPNARVRNMQHNPEEYAE
jgi:hypothetical protein